MKTMDIKKIRSQLGLKKSWDKRIDGWWLEDHEMDVEKMARTMIKIGARLVTMTALPASNDDCKMIYHWDIKGHLLNFITATREGKLPSIANICPAANWIEREIHDYFAVNFTGRELPPLVLRPDDISGIFRWDFQWKGEQGGKK